MREIIKELWSVRDTLTEASLKEPEIKKAILDVIDGLDSGSLRVAHKHNREWLVNDWIKKAILLYTKVSKKYVSNECGYRYFDKLPLKFQGWDESKFETTDMRVTPGTIVRKGAYIAKSTILKPSFISIGAYIGSHTVIDTYSNIGSCAQIGSNVHIGAYTGVAGTLEPIFSRPSVIEDRVHIAPKCEIGAGVIVREGSILTTGVNIEKSTKIFDKETEEIYYGEIPPYSVVVPGVLPNSNGEIFTYAAIIVKRIDEEVRVKKSIDEIVREHRV